MSFQRYTTFEIYATKPQEDALFAWMRENKMDFVMESGHND